MSYLYFPFGGTAGLCNLVCVGYLCSLSPRHDPSIPAHVWSKPVLVTYNLLSKAKFLQFSMVLLRNVKLCTALIVYWCQWLILYICFAQFFELGKNWFLYAITDLGYGLSTYTALSHKNRFTPTPTPQPGIHKR
jgi:hypothetical protein